MMHVYVIVMVAQFVFLFLAGKTSKRQYYYIKTQIDNNFPWSVLFSIIEMTANFAVKANLALRVNIQCKGFIIRK